MGKLNDLNDQTQTARKNVAEATQLYFENRDPDASFKAHDIKAMKAAARANVKFGNELLDVANGNVTQANDAFRRLNDLSRSISNNVDELVVKVEGERAGLQENELLLNQTSDHANQLEEEATNMENTVETAKTLAAEPLKAANAYKDIKQGLDNAKSAVESAVAASNEAASKSMGVRAKAESSRERTQELNENAQTNSADLEILEPKLKSAIEDIKKTGDKNTWV